MFLISYLFQTQQAQPLSTVKAAYDYAASAPGELTITDGQLLEVHERPADDDWILVQSKDPAAGNESVEVGYVPATYVEEVSSCEYVLNNGRSDGNHQ
jgi:actin cytoskeleton-regulatory complex protein SLA1